MKPMINRKLLPDPDTLGTTLLSPPITYSPDPLFNASTKSPHSTTTSFRPNSPLDSSVAITALVLLTALFFMGFFSLYLRLFADDYSPSSSSSSSSSSLPLWRRSSNYPKGLDPCTVRSLPLVSYGGAAKHPIDCVICLCEFEEGETVKMIPHCRHVFHPECIDTWLGSHASCPLCRSSRIFVGGGEMCLGVTRVEVDHGGGESLGRSTVEIEEEERGMEVGPAGRVRRACSYPSLGEVDDDGRSGSLERSTVEIEEEGGMEVGPAGMVRRASSYPSMGDRVVLKRSLSF